MTGGTTDREPFDDAAKWIWSAEEVQGRAPDPGPFRVRLFRRAFQAPAGASLVVCVTADSAYKLWCNGKLVSRGPARGDVAHHFYECVDVGEHLRKGANCLAAQVVYYGDVWCRYDIGGAPVSCMTACPGFAADAALRAEDGTELEQLHTDDRWAVWIDLAYMHHAEPACSALTGMQEDLTCAEHPWGFEHLDFDDGHWPRASELCEPIRLDGDRDSFMPHRLLPRMIAPLAESGPRRFARAFRSPTGCDLVRWSLLLERDHPLILPPGTSCAVLIDAGDIVTGYPMLRFSGGRGAVVRLRYSEALETAPRQRGKRGDLASGDVRGYYDIVRPDGPNRTYEPFDWRTFRFVRVEAETGDEELALHGLMYRFSAYPLRPLASYESSDPEHRGIRDICWRSARLCAQETYVDCPYFERLQYGADTQIQAMISYVVAGDASLARQFLYQFDWSRQPNGLTRSRYPSRLPQTIPYWSLHWVLSAKDYWEYTGDLATIRALLPGLGATMEYFLGRIKADGTIGRLDGWRVSDWSPGWRGRPEGNGVPPGASEGRAAFDSLMTVSALDALVDLLSACGRDATEFAGAADDLRRAAHDVYFDGNRGLYRDRPEGAQASAYTNVWAILARMPCDHARLAGAIRGDDSLSPLTMFSQYFAWRAFAAAGRYDLAAGTFAPWRRMLEWQLTTCPEIPDFVRNRSDCHGWSAGAIVEFYREILGVRPAGPGYAAIGIEPKPLNLSFARGRVPLTRLDGSESPRFVGIDWRIEGGEFLFIADTPEGTPVKVLLPRGRRHEFGGGHIEFSEPVG